MSVIGDESANATIGLIGKGAEITSDLLKAFLLCSDLLYMKNMEITKCRKCQRAYGKSLRVTVTGIGHSVIRGLATDRSMVRRESCCLKA